MDVRHPLTGGSTETGTVFSAYDYGSTDAVYVYPPNSAKTSMKITKGLGTFTFEPALDSQNNLYVFSFTASNQCQVTVYSPPKYHLLRSISPSGCGGEFLLEPNGNLLFFVGGASYGCGSPEVAEYSNDGTLLRTLSGFGTTPNVVAADAAGNIYVVGVRETLRSGYCYQSKPGVYVYEPGATQPSYVIRKGLKNNPFVELTTDSTGYLYVEFQDPNKKGYLAWNSIVAYAPGATTPAYFIRKAPIASELDSYSQNMETFNGQLYVVGTEGVTPLINVYQEHSSKTAYVIKPPPESYYPEALAFDHTGTMYVEADGTPLSICSSGSPSLVVFGPGKKTPLSAICPLSVTGFFTVAW